MGQYQSDRFATIGFAQGMQHIFAVIPVFLAGAALLFVFELVLEYVPELGVDQGSVLLEHRHQRRHIGKTHGLRDDLAIRLVGGEGMGLCIVQVLQPVFQVAQEIVGSQQFIDNLGIQQVFGGQGTQRGAGGAVTQVAIAATADELEYLRQELDFANPATPQLDVVAALRMQCFQALYFRADLRVHGAHGVDRTVIQVAPEHERAADVLQCGDIFRPACQRAGFAPGIALPFPALGHQVCLYHVEAGDQRPRGAIRPQRHVNPESEAVFGDFRQRANQFFAEPGKELVIRQ